MCDLKAESFCYYCEAIGEEGSIAKLVPCCERIKPLLCSLMLEPVPYGMYIVLLKLDISWKVGQVGNDSRLHKCKFSLYIWLVESSILQTLKLHLFVVKISQDQ